MEGWGSPEEGSSDGDGAYPGEGETEGKRRDKEIRVFRVSVDVRSFKANMHLPRRSVNASVRLLLPAELVSLAVASCNTPSKVSTPLRFHPPVLVSRGTEVSIRNGYVTLELPASFHGMAAMLALQPQVIIHVLHHDKYEADIVVGVAYIPMNRLIEQPLLEIHAPVFGAPTLGRTDKAKIGSVHVVLAVQELGPVKVFNKNKLLRVGGPPRRISQPGWNDPRLDVGRLFSRQGFYSQAEESKLPDDNSTEDSDESKVPVGKTRSESEVTSNKRSRSPPKRRLAYVGEKLDPKEIMVEENRQHPGYKMTWEFEMWRRTEEAKWQAEMKEKEVARMNMLEEEWIKRNKHRELETRSVQLEQANIECRLQAKLFKLEKRERAIILAEEESTHRQAALKWEYGRRSSDAQVAMKRLQGECEHRVELEHSKYVALQEQHAMLEQRVSTANASLTTLEKQFLEFRATQRGTSETELVSQITALKQCCSDCQRRAELAVQASNGYKAQVLRMAKQLASFHREHTAAETKLVVHLQDQLDAQSVASILESQAQKVRQDRLELLQLKEQLEHLQLYEKGAMKAAPAPVLQSVPEKLGEEGLDVSGIETLSSIETLTQAEAVGGKGVTDLRVFQDSQDNHCKSPGTGLEASSEKPLAEMGQKQKGLLEVCIVQEPESKGKTGALEDPSLHLEPSDIASKVMGHRRYDIESSAMSNKGEIARLSKQRGELLQTGVYNVTDYVIKGLDLEIHRLQVGLGSRSPF